MKKLEHIVPWIVKIGLFAIPFLPLYISGSMLFPFITGKNFGFRIITEILFVLWAWLAVANPIYRPKLNNLFRAVTIFMIIVFFADLFGPNPYRSFFSNYERMEGFMMIGHMYLYFVMLVSMLRKKDWMIFFHSTLAASLIVSYIALLQKLGVQISLQGGFRVDSTIGNPTYLAAYLLFHLWILFILMHAYRRKWWALALYSAAFLFELMIIYFTATRGAIIGLVISGVALAMIMVGKWGSIFPSRTGARGQKASWPMGRKIAALILAVIIATPIFFFLIRNTQAIQSNQVLRRLTNYSLSDGTIQARFHIWGQSWKGFLERPILGWGQENYYLVFQKFYNPALWGDEPWFDRSHNIFFDWLIHAGLLGLGAYFAMYFFVYKEIIKGMRKNHVPLWAGSVVLAALFAHLIQNIFVFDNLNTYLLFFAFLAFASFLIEGSDEGMIKVQAISRVSHSRASAVGIILVVCMFIWSYNINLTAIRQSQALIYALIGFQNHVPIDQQIDLFKKTLAYNSFGTTETHEQIANMARSILGNQRYSNKEQEQYAIFAIDELRKEVRQPAKDVKHLLILGSILNQSLSFNPDYVLEAKNVLEEAVRMSPTKQMISFELAQFYVMTGQIDAARDAVYKAWKYDTSYKAAGIHAWVLAVMTRRQDIIDEAAHMFLITNIAEVDLVRLGEAYRRINDYAGALPFYAQLVVAAPDTAKYHATFAALLANAGRFDEARKEAAITAKLDPSFANDATNFLNNLDK